MRRGIAGLCACCLLSPLLAEDRTHPTTVDEYLTAMAGDFGPGVAPETPRGTSRVQIVGEDGAVRTVTVETDAEDRPEPANRAFLQELLLTGSRRLKALYLAPVVAGEIALAKRTLRSQPDDAERWRHRLAALEAVAAEIEAILEAP